MRIVMADSGVAFDGLTPKERPLGGAESAFVALAEALADEGADVTAYAVEARPMTHYGVRWRPTEALANERALRQIDCDLYIANRDPALLRAPLRAAKTAYWLHNPAGFLNKPRFAARLVAKRPILVFAGPHHASTAPLWTRALQTAKIPLGVERAFLDAPRAPGAPPPRAIFTSNPMRGLRPLAQLWASRIHPAAPQAELHVFAGPQVYGAGGERAAAMRERLDEAAALPGVLVHPPLPKADLARMLGQARVLLYFGDPGETFCLSVAEAQAMGVPAVVKPIGPMAERVEDGVTGAVASADDAFADAAVRLLTNDTLWARWSRAALARRATQDWRIAARAFIRLSQGGADEPELPPARAVST